MRTTLTLAILLASLLVAPAMAATRWVCPIPSVLPQTLALSSSMDNAQSHKLEILQDYLSNLKAINAAYKNARSRGARNAVANCLIYHLATLHDGKALLAPKTRADGATWFLFTQEVLNALNTIDPFFFRTNPQVGLVYRWLQNTPAYGAGTPYSVSSR